jgi:hypothetical protein
MHRILTTMPLVSIRLRTHHTRLFATALSAGITTFVAMDAGPMWNVGVNPPFFLQRMFELFEEVPIIVCF